MLTKLLQNVGGGELLPQYELVFHPEEPAWYTLTPVSSLKRALFWLYHRMPSFGGDPQGDAIEPNQLWYATYELEKLTLNWSYLQPAGAHFHEVVACASPGASVDRRRVRTARAAIRCRKRTRVRFVNILVMVILHPRQSSDIGSSYSTLCPVTRDYSRPDARTSMPSSQTPHLSGFSLLVRSRETRCACWASNPG